MGETLPERGKRSERKNQCLHPAGDAKKAVAGGALAILGTSRKVTRKIVKEGQASRGRSQAIAWKKETGTEGKRLISQKEWKGFGPKGEKKSGGGAFTGGKRHPSQKTKN